MQSWRLASDAFACGRGRSAKTHLARAKSGEQQDVGAVDSLKLPPFVSCCFEVNKAAIEVEQASTERSGVEPSGVGAACEKAESAATLARSSNTRHRPFVGLAEAAFCSEVAATSAYNSALASVYADNATLALRSTEDGLADVLVSTLNLVDIVSKEGGPGSFERSSPPAKRRRKDFSSGAIDLLPPTSCETSSTWFRATTACESLRSYVSEKSNRAAVHALQRWADSVGALFELTGAIHLLLDDFRKSRDAVAASKTFFELSTDLRILANGAEKPSPAHGMSEKMSAERGGLVADPGRIEWDSDTLLETDRRPAGIAEDADDADEDSVLGDEVNGAEHVHVDRVGLDETYRSDHPGSRGLCVVALGFALSGEWGTGLVALETIVSDVLSEQEKSVRFGPLNMDPGHHWPSVYVASIILFRRGREGDHRSAVLLLDACTAAGYRPIDSTALSARICHWEAALPRWERVMSMDHARRGGLWTAARAFAVSGRHGARASLLECLEQLLEMVAEGQEVDERPGGQGNVSLAPPTSRCKYPCTLHVCKCPKPQLSQLLTADLVRVEAARARGACGKHAEAVSGLSDYATAICEGDSWGVDTLDVEGILRDYCWALTCAQDLGKALAASDDALSRCSSNEGCCAALLAKADSLVNSEKVDEALEAVSAAFHKADLARISSSGEGLGTNESSSFSDGDAAQFLRGVCYNNMGVLYACQKNLARSDSCFAAARVSFGKAVENGRASPWRQELLRYAKLNRDAAVFNRSLILLRRGAVDDAMSMWLSYTAECAETAPHDRDMATIAQGSDGEALQAVQDMERTAIEQTLPSMRVGAAHVIGQLSQAQKSSLTVICVAQRNKEHIEASIQRELDRVKQKSTGFISRGSG